MKFHHYPREFHGAKFSTVLQPHSRRPARLSAGGRTPAVAVVNIVPPPHLLGYACVLLLSARSSPPFLSI